jgi:hypothetical protein
VRSTIKSPATGWEIRPLNGTRLPTPDYPTLLLNNFNDAVSALGPDEDTGTISIDQHI